MLINFNIFSFFFPRPTFLLFIAHWGRCTVHLSTMWTPWLTLNAHRFGAVVAAGVYSLFPENGIVLSIFGFFFSLPCFYYIVAKPEYATTGRFVLLTYNLTCLYAYVIRRGVWTLCWSSSLTWMSRFNIREENIPVLDIAYHRSTSVTVGVIWALIASRLWWPSEARRELSKALGE